MGSRAAPKAERNDMTAKRDLKRRVRQRQARTGESYVTARRRVLAARGEQSGQDDTQPGEAGRPDPPGPGHAPGIDGLERTHPGDTAAMRETSRETVDRGSADSGSRIDEA